MTKDEAEQEAKAVNAYAKAVVRKPEKCEECGGSGRCYAPLYGDPGLGYADAGECPVCKGTRYMANRLSVVTSSRGAQ